MTQHLRFACSSLGVQVLELAGSDLALGHELVDLGLLEADYAPKSVRGQLALIDKSIQRSRNQSECCGRFFGCLLYTSPSPRDRG